MNPPTPSPDNSAHKERHKTYRLAMVLGVGVLLAVLGMNVVKQGTTGGGKGKVDVDFRKGKFSLTLDRPLVDQLGVEKHQAQGGTGMAAQFTEGTLKQPELVDAVAALDASPTAFAGKNFINRQAGFFFSVNNPELWQIQHNPGGMLNPLLAVNTIHDAQGTHLNVNVETVPAGTTLQTYMQAAIQLIMSMGVTSQMPQVTYDQNTAFVVVAHNNMTGGQSYMKVVLDPSRNRVYSATANYHVNSSSQASLQDLQTMIASFTVLTASRS